VAAATAHQIPEAAQRVPAPDPPARRSRLDTPARLWLLLFLAVAAILAAGCVAGVGLADRQSTAAHTAQSTEALYAEVQDLAYNLADANATAATSLLVGAETPPQFSQRFNADITQAEDLLAEASQRVAGDPYASQRLNDLAERIPVYTGLVGQAQADNRFGYPVAGAYLREASAMVTGPMLAETGDVIAEQQKATASGIGSASSFDVVLLVIVLLALVALLVVGRRLAKLTHRRVNIGLLGGALVVLALFGLSLAAYSGASGHAGIARTDFNDLSQAQRETSELSLAETYVALQQINRGEDQGVNAEAASVALKAADPAHPQSGHAYSAAAAPGVHTAQTAFDAFSTCSQHAISLAADGQFTEAVSATVGDGGGGVPVGAGGCESSATSLSNDLNNVYKAAQARFDQDMNGMSGDYAGSGALPLGIAAGLLGAAAAAYGLNRRLAEFR
jgi:hypothetical protein